MFNDPGHRNNAEWLKLSAVNQLRPWWPRRCAISGKWVWIKPAIRVRRMITGPGDPVIIDHWVEAKTFTFQSLKGWD